MRECEREGERQRKGRGEREGGERDKAERGERERERGGATRTYTTIAAAATVRQAVRHDIAGLYSRDTTDI